MNPPRKVGFSPKLSITDGPFCFLFRLCPKIRILFPKNGHENDINIGFWSFFCDFFPKSDFSSIKFKKCISKNGLKSALSRLFKELWAISRFSNKFEKMISHCIFGFTSNLLMYIWNAIGFLTLFLGQHKKWTSG